MKYFLNEEERRAAGSTCYFEFQKGEFKDEYWLSDSLCLHADIFDEMALHALFADALGQFDYYGTNGVTEAQWSCLIAKSQGNAQWHNFVEELRPWVEACFIDHACFTICGI